jgi:hypothetical protein
MIAVPGLDPITIPVDGLMNATDGGVLLHTPPGVVLLIGMLAPTHTCDGPTIGAGSGLTVTTVVVEHPVGNVNVMVVVPGIIPVSSPVVKSIVAIPGSWLIHVPAPIELLSVLVIPTQTTLLPAIVSGSGSTMKVVAT